ncbi:MAG TPA: NAD-dependent epimerase/dehydratase family protein [Spirochaetota bacterium]|nr:NAD-dependent epimerase/dehydratase family protein [Spirochaetota bacterium]
MELMNKNFLVLGGSGFIGQHLSRALINRGCFVRCLALEKPGAVNILGDIENKIEWVTAEFNDVDKIKNSLVDIDIVFHLISTTIPSTSNKNLKADLTDNILPTLYLLEEITRSKVKKIIFISSGGTVYGIPEVIPIPENHKEHPVCGYGIHKLMIEKYLYLYNYLYNLDYNIVRLSNPYGTAQIADRPQGVIGNFLFHVLNNMPIEILGDGKVVRDYIYIEDAIEALISVVLYSGNEKIFNIGSGEGHSLLDIVQTIEQISGSPVDKVFKPGRKEDLAINILDIKKAKSELNWSPRTDLVTGIKIILESARNNFTYA